MSYSKEAFIQLQEAEYYESEAYQLKQQLLMPAAPIKQQAPKSSKIKANGKS